MRLVLLSVPLLVGGLLVAGAWTQRLTLMKQTFLYGFANMNGMKRQYLLALDQARLEFQIGETLLLLAVVAVVLPLLWSRLPKRKELDIKRELFLSANFILGLALFVFFVLLDLGYAQQPRTSLEPTFTAMHRHLGVFAAGSFGLMFVSFGFLTGWKRALQVAILAGTLFLAGLAAFDFQELDLHITNFLTLQVPDGDWMRQSPIYLFSNRVALMVSAGSLLLVARLKN